VSRTSTAATRRLVSAAPVFAALGDAGRLRIVARLCESGPLSIMQLTAGAAISRQAITKHLHALSSAGLACHERRGRETLWRLETPRLAEVRQFLGQISARWDEALDRLKLLVEHDGTG
jgi:DNA-binding transcriptional ArsR family regulator